MFGLEILDVVIGLVLVYLLLSLFATALNEYVAAVLNLRGRELAYGLGRLLDDVDEKGAVREALDGLTPENVKKTLQDGSLTERLYNHRLVRPLATRRSILFSFRKSPRLPSYIPARTFAMALLDVLRVHDDGATVPAAAAPQPAAKGEQPAARVDTGRITAELANVLEILKRESPMDVSQARGAVTGLLANPNLEPAARVGLLNALSASETQLQKLHDSVEVWFNNAMDRVSGAYKRKAQGWLFVLGLLIASFMNADTIDMWHRLSENDELREAMVRRAEATVAALDTTLGDSASAFPADTTRTVAVQPAAPGADRQIVRLTAANPAGGDTTQSDSAKLAAVRQARLNYQASLARLDSMELKLGWTAQEAERVGLIRKDAAKPVSARTATPPAQAARPALGSAAKPDSAQAKRGWIPPGYHAHLLFPFSSRAGFLKAVGLLLTALAISLGAPFWFDLLNKVISIRTAGRSPEEKPKSPEGGPKRLAERAPK